MPFTADKNDPRPCMYLTCCSYLDARTCQAMELPLSCPRSLSLSFSRRCWGAYAGAMLTSRMWRRRAMSGFVALEAAASPGLLAQQLS
jgi:hypothetical protein